jgi:carbamoyltransferase
MPARAAATIELPLEPGLKPLANPSESPWDPFFKRHREFASATDRRRPRSSDETLSQRRPRDALRMALRGPHLSHEASAFLAAPLKDGKIAITAVVENAS